MKKKQQQKNELNWKCSRKREREREHLENAAYYSIMATQFESNTLTTFIVFLSRVHSSLSLIEPLWRYQFFMQKFLMIHGVWCRENCEMRTFEYFSNGNHQHTAQSRNRFHLRLCKVLITLTAHFQCRNLFAHFHSHSSKRLTHHSCVSLKQLFVFDKCAFCGSLPNQ